MFMITVSFGSSSCPLLFKTPEAAKTAWAALTKPWESHNQTLEQLRNNATNVPPAPIVITDDFGRICCMTGSNFNGAIFEDMNVAQEGQIEIGLHQARTQVKANQRGRSDPVLAAAAQQQGPAIISPMGGNGRVF